MKNNFEKIANIHLKISEDCSKENIKILKRYWKIENEDFVNSPTLIKRDFSLTQGELTKLTAKNASFIFYLLCENCNSYEKHFVFSQSAYKHVLSNHNSRYTKSFNCDHCKEIHIKNQRLEYIRKEEELLKKQNLAIDNKNWENISNFEREILGNCLEMNFNQLKNHYWNLLGRSNFYKLISGLEAIENQDLIELNRENYNQYINSYSIENRLKEFKEEILFIDEITESSVEIDTETNELKFKLTINENQQHPDQPMYAGTVTFKERIVIEPNVEYAFGQWQRAKKNLYLTMIPIDKLEKMPTQKKISKLPISIKQGVTDFLTNIGKNIK